MTEIEIRHAMNAVARVPAPRRRTACSGSVADATDGSITAPTAFTMGLTAPLQATATTGQLGVRFLTDGAGTDGYFGPALDHVALAPAASTVPEPPSCLLTAAAGAMLLAYRRRGR